jgi:hypothetical protein
VDDPDSWAAARLRLVASAYGGVDASAVLTATLARIEHTITGMQTAAAAGDIGMQRLMETTGEPAPTRRALDVLRSRVPAIQKRLRADGGPA